MKINQDEKMKNAVEREQTIPIFFSENFTSVQKAESHEANLFPQKNLLNWLFKIVLKF
jgi:hypothetical protein